MSNCKFVYIPTGTFKGCLRYYLIIIGIFLALLFLAILFREPEVKYSNSVLADELRKYLLEKKDCLEKISNRMLEISPEISFCIIQNVDRNHHEMELVYNHISADTFYCKNELFDLYRNCFKKFPQRETGPEVICKQNVVEFDINFGMNFCDKFPHLLYSKLDTSDIHSRYPNLQYFSRDSQTQDSLCTFLLEIDDNWYIISE